ncbi:MAG: hypothetical protein ABIJ92_04085 [Candidatus Aenigmatarchaeota archaeon]
MVMEFFTGAANLLVGDTLTFIIFEIILLLISALFIWIGAKVAQVKKGSIGRAFLVAIVFSIITPIFMIPFVGYALVTFILTLIINLVIIKIVFSANWRKALTTWVFSIISGIIAVLILGFVLVLLV